MVRNGVKFHFAKLSVDLVIPLFTITLLVVFYLSFMSSMHSVLENKSHHLFMNMYRVKALEIEIDGKTYWKIIRLKDFSHIFISANMIIKPRIENNVMVTINQEGCRDVFRIAAT